MIKIIFLPFLFILFNWSWAATVLDPALVGFWKFEETSGVAADYSLLDRDGTIAGSVTRNQTGIVGQSYYFGGGSMNISTVGSPTNEFSFGGWIKTQVTHEVDPESTGGTLGVTGQRYAFWPTHGGDGNNAGVGLSIGTNGISVYEHASSYMPAVAVYNANIGADWNHIFVTYKDGVASIYLNGVLVKTGVQSAKTGTIYAPTLMGSSVYGNFIGWMDEISIWNKSLSSAEIVDLYTTGIMVIPEPNSLIFLLVIFIWGGFYRSKKS